jgi:SNF2-related domain/Helicase conserved C-terminal domain
LTNPDPVVHALRIGEDDEPQEKLVDAGSEYNTILAGCFERIVLDEGHRVKNPQTLASNLVRLLDPTFTWILTATPVMNRASDYAGYLTLLWKEDMGLDEFDEPIVSKDQYTQNSLVPCSTPSYLKDGRYDFGRYGLPLWRLSPILYRRVMKEREENLSALTSYEVIRNIAQLMTLRRTMATTMEVNGETVRIGSKIPRYKICTVEVDFAGKRKADQYYQRFEGYIPALPQKTPNQSETPTKKKSPRRLPTQTDDDESAMGRNFGIQRRLCLLTMNMGLDKMANRIPRNFAKDVETWYHMHRDSGMSYYFRATRPDRDLPYYADRYSLAMYLAKDSPKLAYLAGLVGKICLGDNPRRVLIYADYPMTHWNIEGFLKVRLSDFSLRTSNDADIHVTQNIGLNVVSLRSSMDAGERASAVDQFNDPNSDVNSLLTSTKASTYGLNLQHNCSDLIIMCVTENINMVVQILGRIHRLGQGSIQRVWIVTQARSWDNILQYDQTHKMISQLAGEAKVEVPTEDDIEDSESDLDHRHDRFKGSEIRRQCENLIMRLLGQKTSRGGEMWADRENLGRPWEEGPGEKERLEIDLSEEEGRSTEDGAGDDGSAGTDTEAGPSETQHEPKEKSLPPRETEHGPSETRPIPLGNPPVVPRAQHDPTENPRVSPANETGSELTPPREEETSRSPSPKPRASKKPKRRPKAAVQPVQTTVTKRSTRSSTKTAAGSAAS